MANFGQTKQQFSAELVSLSSRLLAIVKEIDEVAAYFTANGFQSGGANAFVDGDFSSNYPWITAASINAAVTTLQNISSGFGVPARNTLRVIEPGPI